MSDIEAIKNRVRKLMAYANDGAACDGEIENAMRHAAALIDKHHLDINELNRTEQDVADQTMGRFSGKTESSKFHRWETHLALAVEKLFGCVKHYLDDKQVPLRVNGIVQTYKGKYEGQVKMCRQVCFYGPALEAQEASELFTEWAHLIATMGVIRWGGAYRGDGEMYCQGFADKLLHTAYQMDESREKLTAQAPKLLPKETEPGSTALALTEGKTAITLRARYEVLQERAATWLKEEEGVKLRSGAGRQGSNTGSSAAYMEGVEHGGQAGFGRGAKRKQLGFAG